MSIVAIIPARGGSKGVPGKNIRQINGKPLIVWSIKQALACKKIDRVLVSTDSLEIAQIAINAGAEVPELRPSHLAEDATSTERVLIHAVEAWCEGNFPNTVMLLQPTSPLRLPNSIGAAIALYESGAADSLLSVCESHAFFWKNNSHPQALYDYHNRPRRQDIKPTDRLYRENGSIYLTKTNALLRNKNRLGDMLVMFVMEECESWEIDTEVDFFIVEELMRSVGL